MRSGFNRQMNRLSLSPIDPPKFSFLLFRITQEAGKAGKVSKYLVRTYMITNSAYLHTKQPE